ncbi:MAG: universal stress protein, partial [Saprospiraceae bacterium]|nr:universal stress protein [Saprospiraceae bacterium]
MQADLLVIGQRSGKSHHGILAKKLVRKAKCDALVIPESAPSDIKHILVPIDFSVHSGNALRNAVALAQRLGDDVVIQTLHVYTLPDLSAYQIDRTYDEYHGMLLENLRDAQNAFFENYIPGDRGRIKVELVYKDMPGTARYIKQFAEESNTDFVVMGAKGHSTVDRLLIGSITEAFMMINKEIPTLIIR